MTEDLPMFEGVDTMSPEHVAPAAFFRDDLSEDRTGTYSPSQVAACTPSRSLRAKVQEGSDPWSVEEIAEHWTHRQGLTAHRTLTPSAHHDRSTPPFCAPRPLLPATAALPFEEHSREC